MPIERQPQTTAGRISITAPDDTGRWIQDLRKQDLNLYEDGIQRPVLSLQRDVETPASIGIVVDTSGSMSWKLAAAEAALQHFVRGGVLIYTVGIGTTGAPAMEMGPTMMASMFGGAGIRFGGGFRHHRGGGEDEQVDAATLRSLSAKTGATTFMVNPRVNDLSGLDSHFQSVLAELREHTPCATRQPAAPGHTRFGSRDCAPRIGGASAQMGGQRHLWIRRINQLRPRFQVRKADPPAIYLSFSKRVLRRCPAPRADIDIVEKREKEEEETPRPP